MLVWGKQSAVLRPALFRPLSSLLPPIDHRVSKSTLRGTAARRTMIDLPWFDAPSKVADLSTAAEQLDVWVVKRQGRAVRWIGFISNVFFNALGIARRWRCSGRSRCCSGHHCGRRTEPTCRAPG